MQRCKDKEVLAAARYLGYTPKLAPKVDFGDEDEYWVHGWLIDLLKGDASKVDMLLSPQHCRNDPGDQYLAVVQAILSGVNRSLTRRYQYWLQVKNILSRSSEEA